MKPMSEAPKDRPFLAKFKPVGRAEGHTVFCRLRAPVGTVVASKIDDPTFPRWDVSASPVYFNDEQFEGWVELPEGFTNPHFRELVANPI